MLHSLKTRCFLPSADWSEACPRLSRDESHHLLHVLRVPVGECVDVFDGAGQTGQAKIVGRAGQRAELRILDRQRAAREGPEIFLLQSLPKAQRMDLVVQKATELEAAAVRPLIAERVVVHYDARQQKSRVERWQRIALNAARQSGNPWLPAIEPIAPLATVDMGGYDLAVLASLEEDAEPIRDVLQRARAAGPRRIALLIGPEGDFSPAESAAMRAAGAVPASYGTRVLRTETAAIFGLSVLRYEFGGGEKPQTSPRVPAPGSPS